MPLWLRPPVFVDTVEDALALPDNWAINRDFIERFAGTLPEEEKRLWISSYCGFLWNSFVVSGWFNDLLYKSLLLFLFIALLRRLVTPRLICHLPPPFRRLHTLYVKHITLAPLFGSSNLASVSPFGRKSQLAKWTTVQIPLRLSSAVVGAYLLANAAVVFTGYEPVVPSAFYPDDPTPFRQNVRYLADRAGILALGSTPLVILLGARNSPFSWLGGINFGTMQIAHRWVARATFVNVGLHAAGYSYLFLLRSKWRIEVLWEKPYVVWGWIAFGGGALLCFGAWRRLRQIAYEAFLAFHIIAAILWVLFSYLHILYLHGVNPDHLRLAYLAAAAWAFDRVLRLFSLLWNNTSLGRLFQIPLLPSTSRSLAAQGSIIGATDDFLRLRITPKTPWSRRRGGPGAYVFISSWTTLAHKGYESHPFSISWPLGVPDAGGRNCEERSRRRQSTPMSPPLVHTPGTETPTKLYDLSPFPSIDPAPSERSPLLSPRPHPFDLIPSPRSFELLIKRYSGFTRALATSLSLPLSSLPSSEFDDSLALTSEQLHHLKIAVEGPYGSEPSSAIARYGQALLVVGGSGVAAATSQLADLAIQTLEGEADMVRTRKVAVVWSVRESGTVHLLAPYLLHVYNLLRTSRSFSQKHLDPSSSFSPFLDLHIFVTGADASLSEADSTIVALSLPLSFLRVAVHSGRPDIGAHIDAFSSRSELVVVSCGPASLCDSAREAVRSRLAGSFCADAEESVEGGDEEDLLGGGGKRSTWEASRLSHSEEAVVW